MIKREKKNDARRNFATIMISTVLAVHVSPHRSLLGEPTSESKNKMDGSGRDSYLLGKQRPSAYRPHDINARRDQLPDNVFAYLKEQADREHFEHYVYETQKARVMAEVGSGRGGKRIQADDTGAAAESAKLTAEQRMVQRHLRVKELYAAERRAWDAELKQRGLSLDDGLK
jgi:hypothetical protein